MLRLKANKTSLYKLVAEFATPPGIRQTKFWKAPRRPDFFLEWSQADGYAQAVFAACMGRPLLTITVRDIDGNQVSRITRHPAVADLKERRMVEELTTEAERRRDKITAGGADNGGLSPAT